MPLQFPWCSCCGDRGVITVCVCVDCLRVILDRYDCHNQRCNNRMRYTSGLCGVCDLIVNQGSGKLLSDGLKTGHRFRHPTTERDV